MGYQFTHVSNSSINLNWVDKKQNKKHNQLLLIY